MGNTLKIGTKHITCSDGTDGSRPALEEPPLVRDPLEHRITRPKLCHTMELKEEYDAKRIPIAPRRRGRPKKFPRQAHQ